MTPARTYEYYDFVMAVFVTVLLCSNIIGAAKSVNVGGFNFGAGILFFPMSYALKTLWEIVNTPITYEIVGFLKRGENEDYDDRDTNFTPFSVEV